jgi:hypothetical protein
MVGPNGTAVARRFMDTIHPQVPVLDFECDEEIAKLITLMNNLGIVTLLSCQDIPVRRGNVRRVWVQTFAQVLLPFLGMLDKPGEASDPESLSNRMAPVEETEPYDRDAYPYTDLPRSGRAPAGSREGTNQARLGS